MTNHITFLAAASLLLIGSGAVAQTADTATSGTLETGLMVSPSNTAAGASTSTTETVASGSTRTTTTVTVAPKNAPMMSGESPMIAGERG